MHEVQPRKYCQPTVYTAGLTSDIWGWGEGGGVCQRPVHAADQPPSCRPPKSVNCRYTTVEVWQERSQPVMDNQQNYRLSTLGKPRSPLILDEERCFLRVYRHRPMFMHENTKPGGSADLFKICLLKENMTQTLEPSAIAESQPRLRKTTFLDQNCGIGQYNGVNPESHLKTVILRKNFMINRKKSRKQQHLAAILILLGPQLVRPRTDVWYSTPAEMVSDWSIRGARDTYRLILDYPASIWPQHITLTLRAEGYKASSAILFVAFINNAAKVRNWGITWKNREIALFNAEFSNY